MAPLIPIKKILEPLYLAPSPANNETLTLYFLLCSASSSYIQSMLSWYILHDLHSACSFDIIAGVILSPKTLVYYHLENYHTKL